MALVLIVVAALSEAGLARRSLQLALEANEAQNSLERRWAAASCRELILNQAPDLFIQLEDSERKKPHWPAPNQVACEFTMGGLQLRLVLSDEDSKTSLNAIYARRPQDVQQSLVDSSGGGFATELHPDTSREAQLQMRWFASWGQVFPLADLFTNGRFDDFLKTTAELTLWGEGKPNIRRASDHVLEKAATDVLGHDVARKLLRARAESEDDLLVPTLLQKLALRRADELKLRSALSDSSSCFSLWLELGQRDQRWYHLWLSGERSPAGGPAVLAFQW